MQYFELVIIAMIVAQSLKYVTRLWVSRTFSVRDMGKTYLYNSGFPSAHATVITASSWYFLNIYGFDSPLVQSHLLFSYFWLFEIYMQRKRHSSSTEYFLESVIDNKEHLKILQDLHGHSMIDLAGGIALGSVLYFSLLG